MTVTLPDDAQIIVEDHVRSGRFDSPEAVVLAVLRAMDRRTDHEVDVDLGGGRTRFKPGEIDALIAEGENSGPPLDGLTVLAELREWRQAQRSARENA